MLTEANFKTKAQYYHYLLRKEERGLPYDKDNETLLEKLITEEEAALDEIEKLDL